MRYFLALLIVTTLATAAQAQYGMGVVTYDVNFPAGDLKEYTDNESWRGLTIEGRKFFAPQISAGLSWSWRTFHENSDELIEFEGGAASGNQFRRFYVSPILAVFHFYLFDQYSNARFLPFAGLGIGTYWIEKKLDMGVYIISDSNWHFGLMPEVGFMVPVGYSSHMIAAFHYDYAFGNNDAGPYDYWGFKIGATFSH
jgi:hypothetical protein